jgi:pSer/pThr/pTyr-binding forkhead associated (FHA) protein
MHGTYVNKKHLQREEPTQLSDGDEITFGAQVNRGLEVFPACAFKLKLDFVPFK